jgi:hypothetical protein
MSGLPDYESFYSKLHTRFSRKRVARLYQAMGWKVRKCTWFDYEAQCPWAEVVIEARDPMLLHGAVADVLANVEALLSPLRAAGIAFEAECYGPQHELLRELANDGGAREESPGFQG